MVRERNSKNNATILSRQQSRRSSTQKNPTVEVFNCACGKTYNSFPALYLHNKLKHGLTIRAKQKAKMMKRKVWSGKNKKIIYEFGDDDEYQQLKTESNSGEKMKLRPKIRKSSKREEEKKVILKRGGKITFKDMVNLFLFERQKST